MCDAYIVHHYTFVVHIQHPYTFVVHIQHHYTFVVHIQMYVHLRVLVRTSNGTVCFLGCFLYLSIRLLHFPTVGNCADPFFSPANSSYCAHSAHQAPPLHPGEVVTLHLMGYRHCCVFGNTVIGRSGHTCTDRGTV